MRAICCLLLLGLWSLVIASCPYYRFSKNHSYCLKPNKECDLISSVPATPAEITEIVRVHNQLRSKVASGKERGLEPAADMLEMQWDDELAEIARRWAAQCVYGHDCEYCHSTRHFKVGQNVHKFGAKNWTYTINNWYSEVKGFNPVMVDRFGYPSIRRDIAHFTQVIWAISWRVGCGHASYTKDGAKWELSVCDYGPWGNYPMEPVYKRGEMCSQCPKNTCCGDKCKKFSYPGLCQVRKGEIPVYDPPAGTNFLYYCNFSNVGSCNITISTEKKWTVYDSLSGNYIGIILEKGEESSFSIRTVVKTTSVSCLTVRYRKGPNVMGEESGNEGEVLISDVLDHKPTWNLKLEEDIPDFLPRMSQSDMPRTYAGLTVRFKALKGTQYLEIKEISILDGICTPTGTYP